MGKRLNKHKTSMLTLSFFNIYLYIYNTSNYVNIVSQLINYFTNS